MGGSRFNNSKLAKINNRGKMKITLIIFISVLISGGILLTANAYPPAVGILGSAKNCLTCHINNGPWLDNKMTIIDILDGDSKVSLKQTDGSFLLKAKKGQNLTVFTVIGRAKEAREIPPYRNAWLFIDPNTIGNSALSKFPPGWEVNLPMACRLVGDKIAGYEEARVTVLPMSILPTDSAKDAEIILQVMLTKGESIKGKPKEGMVGNYFERKVRFKVD
jgi:hypothetical protein